MGLPYGGEITVLNQVVKRVLLSKLLSKVIIATTDGKEDFPIVQAAKAGGIDVHRGSRDNVLSRYYGAAKAAGADTVVRITSDCPCIDPEIIDKVIAVHLRAKRSDYTSNTLVRSYPRGMDTEVFGFNALERAFNEATLQYEMEHVTPYIYTHREKFKIGQVVAEKRFLFPDWRLTLDTRADYAFLCSIYEELYPDNPNFSLKEIVALLIKKPWLLYINEQILQKKIKYSPREELAAAKKMLLGHGLVRAAELLRGKTK